jgi:hypothetical protein
MVLSRKEILEKENIIKEKVHAHGTIRQEGFVVRPGLPRNRSASLPSLNEREIRKEKRRIKIVSTIHHWVVAFTWF